MFISVSSSTFHLFSASFRDVSRFASAAPPSPPQNLAWQDQNKSSVQLTWETPLRNGGSMITGYIVERCEDGTDKWLRCNARLCPDLFYKVLREFCVDQLCRI